MVWNFFLFIGLLHKTGDDIFIPSFLIDEGNVKLFFEEIRLQALECVLSPSTDISKIVDVLKAQFYFDQ